MKHLEVEESVSCFLPQLTKKYLLIASFIVQSQSADAAAAQTTKQSTAFGMDWIGLNGGRK